MKICCISDLHGFLPELQECELVLICGDSVPLNYQSDSEYTYIWYSTIFKKWAKGCPCNKVLFIAGNHDKKLQYNYDTYKDLFNNKSKVTYLEHEEYTYISKEGKEYKIFGTPYCHEFGNWAFMDSDEALEDLYYEIPGNLNILMSHDTPYGACDILLQKDYTRATGEHLGNNPLRKAIEATQPNYCFCGHLHSGNHECETINNTKVYNCSMKDEFYQVAYNPLYLEI